MQSPSTFETMTSEDLVAHRGWQKRYPENTLLGVEQAILAGARNVEIDIQFSADQEPVLFHDANLLRLCGIDHATASLTLKELTALTVSERERLGHSLGDGPMASLANLATLLARYPGVHLYAEVKTDILVHCSRELTLEKLHLALAPIRERVTLISFDYAILRRAIDQGWRVGAVVLQWSDLFDESIATEAECVFIDALLVPEQVRLDELPWKAVIYEVTDITAARYWKGRGADKIETFCIGELLSDIDKNDIEKE